MEESFNAINIKLVSDGIGKYNRKNIRLVFDDDKIYCENKTSPWHSMCKVIDGDQRYTTSSSLDQE
jgi:hypothetical protein